MGLTAYLKQKTRESKERVEKTNRRIEELERDNEQWATWYQEQVEAGWINPELNPPPVQGERANG